MHLRTLGGVALEGASFGRPKPLLLLAYLAVEGPKSRRFMSELLWGAASQPMNSLRVALSQLRTGAPGSLIEDGGRLACGASSDTQLLTDLLERGDVDGATALYSGAFLDGFDLKGAAAAGAGVELEEWVFATREYLAERLRNGFLKVAEQDAAVGDFASAARRAEAALDISGAPPLEPLEVERLHLLLAAVGSGRRTELERYAREYGIHLMVGREDARARLAPDGASHSAAPNNLPSPLTEFVGRDPEQLELAQLLDRAGTRLVTLTGLGGVGKTRLALHLAHSKARDDSYPDGVYFVSLESLTEGPLVPAAIAAALGAQLPNQTEALDELTDLLRERRVLLVLDNCEHLPGIDRVAARLIANCPDLKLLATSRERIHLPAEQLFPLEGLTREQVDGASSEPGRLPRRLTIGSRTGDQGTTPAEEDVPLEAAHQDATRLFVQQARRVRPGFEPSRQQIEDIREICRLVHGFPLGIELAAARFRAMSTSELAREMAQSLDFLEGASGSISPRHRGLRAAFEHSWRLLSQPEAQAMRKLSVFTGGFSREAAARVAGATIPLLAALVDKSLLRTNDSGRFDRHPLIHQYTVEKLADEPKELGEAREDHLRWFVAHAEEAEGHTAGQAQRIWLERLEKEQNNLRVALGWAFANDTSSERTLLGLRLAVALYRFWYFRSHLAEGRRWLSLAIASSEALGETVLPLRSKALYAAGVLADEQGDRDAATRLFEARLELARRLDDLAGQATTLNSLGVVSLARKEYDRAKEFLERSLELRGRIGSRELLDTPRLNLGLVALAQEDYASAQEHFEYSLELSRELGKDMGTAIALTNLGAIHVDRGDVAGAEAAFAEAVQLYRSLGNKDGLTYCLDGFAAVAVLRRRFDLAARLAGAAASLRERVGIDSSVSTTDKSEQRLTPARDALGARFDSIWRQGYECGSEQMLATALADSAESVDDSR